MTPQVGQRIGPLEERTTRRRLVQYAGASGDFYEIHYDDATARATGLPGVIVHGLLKAAYLGRLATSLGPDVRLRSLEVRYRGLDLVDHELACHGEVTSIADGVARVDLWIEDDAGTRTTAGTAEIELPGRAGGAGDRSAPAEGG
ncbi:MAG: MaoC/PaaZ C-terminal domain-containing protein [Candidatus Dormiibacterota bacterium]